MIDFTVVGREVSVSDFMWNAIYDHVSRLDRFFDRIIHCEVGISSPHRHHRKGKVFHIRVRLKIPGQDIIVNREPERSTEHEDFYLALNDVFKVVTRKLQDRARKMRTVHVMR